MISRYFIKSSLIYSVIGALPLASSIVLLPFYTNMLTTVQFGELALYIAFTGIMQLLVNFSLDQYLGTHWVDFKDDIRRAKENVGTVVSLLLLFGLMFVLVFIFTGEPIFSSFSGLTKNKTILTFFPWGFMSLLTAIFNSLFKSYTALLVYQQRPVRFFWLNIFNFVLTIGISLSVLYYKPFSLAGPMYGRLLSGVGIFLLALFYFVKEFGISFHIKLIKGMAVFCFPLLVSYILYWVSANVDRYIIAYFLSASDVGIFVFAIQCTLILDFFHSGLTASIFPKVFNLWKENNSNYSTNEVNRYFNGFTAITLLIIPVLVIILPLIIPLVVKNTNFYLTFNFLAILFAGYALSGLSVYFLAPIMYFKKTKALPKVFFFSSVFQIIATVGLIHYFGLIGAVWAKFLVKPVQLLLLFIESRKIYDYKINLWKLVYTPVIFVVIVMISQFTASPETRVFFETGQLVIVFVMVSLVYRKELIPIIRERFR
ncbi:MAG: polysaccharide biosynthesis C-terminal domain-containing protein [Bacteroidetes bacterium]|nr:polysaccharide biosynthesis C-terminal domain-containing protein [Bacteroidota bacterium]